MLTLYMKPTCPFSAKVMGAAEELGVTLELKDVKNNQEFSDELIALGGKRQVPFLLNSDSGEKMYESDSIIDYLKKNYGNGSKVNVHKTDDTCSSS